MTADDGVQAALFALMLLLPLSALLARRTPLGSTVKMAAAWTAIFALAAIVVAQRERVRPFFDRLARTFSGDDDQRVTGGAVRIAMAADGHFWASVRLNGTSRRMLVDSGATDTALSTATAKAAGVDTDQAPFDTLIETANGTVTARRAVVRSLTLGGIVARDLPVVVSPAFGDIDVLGMNFLSRLGSWRVEGRTLVLLARDRPTNFT